MMLTERRKTEHRESRRAEEDEEAPPHARIALRSTSPWRRAALDCN